MDDQEPNSHYKCTVYGYHVFHKWSGGGVPSQSMDLQEMGVDGQDNTEPGGSNDDNIYFFSCVVDLMIRKITQ
jgi:hypothetical protein